MEDPKVLERMRADWNERAGEDANYYVAFGRRDQDEEEFFSTGTEMAKGLELELKRLRGKDAALEIGCGPGRLMRPLSRHFAEIHGVDVSDQMIRLAEERLSATPNAHPHHTSGSDLGLFPDDKFDFVYSYAVFQHIPSKDVVFNYLREARRVLKHGGILRCQINGLPPLAKQYDTWSGVRIPEEEIRQFTIDQDLQLLVIEQVGTQYMWITCRKRPAGWGASLKARIAAQAGTRKAAIRTISNALTGEAVAPSHGPLAALSLWVEALPDEVDLHTLTVTADGGACRVVYIGEPEKDGITQVNVTLPEVLRTGLVPVEMFWFGQPLATASWVRIMPAGPSVPRIGAITDGINMLSTARIITRTVKVTMHEVADATLFRAHIDGVDAIEIESFCADPVTQRYEFNFGLPAKIVAGPHEVTVSLGRRIFAPLPIEVV